MSPRDTEVLERRRVRVSIEAEVDDDTAERFWGLYQETFGDLRTKAVARQLLHYDEFMAEMTDHRVDKYLAYGPRGEAVAMCTLTRHLETVPWISPDYFAHHYPEHTRRDAVYYLGFILVAHRYRRSRVFTSLVRRVAETLVNQRAMCAYDICSYNNEVIGVGDAVEGLLGSVAEIEVQPVDTQTYYHAIAVGPMKLPNMRTVDRSGSTLEAS